MWISSLCGFSASGWSNNRCRNILFLFQQTTTCARTQQHCKSSPVRGRIFSHWSNHKACVPERTTSHIIALLTGPPIPTESHPTPSQSFHHSQKAQDTFLMSQLFFSETIVQSFWENQELKKAKSAYTQECPFNSLNPMENACRTNVFFFSEQSCPKDLSGQYKLCYHWLLSCTYYSIWVSLCT